MTDKKKMSVESFYITNPSSATRLIELDSEHPKRKKTFERTMTVKKLFKSAFTFATVVARLKTRRSSIAGSETIDPLT